MTADLVVTWPVDDLDATLWQLEREARTEWAGHVAAAGLWATEDPTFTVDGDGDRLTLTGRAAVILGPIHPHTWRT